MQRQDVASTLMWRSCIKFYEHIRLKLFLNGPEAVFKHKTHIQIMKFASCLNMDFELLISQDGQCFVYVTSSEVTLPPWT